MRGRWNSGLKIEDSGALAPYYGRINRCPLKKEKAGGELFLFVVHDLGYYNLLGAHVAQSAEHILGKDEVSGSIPLMGSIKNITEVFYG